MADSNLRQSREKSLVFGILHMYSKVEGAKYDIFRGKC